jgi:hypothetical protein
MEAGGLRVEGAGDARGGRRDLVLPDEAEVDVLLCGPRGE